MFTGNIRRGTKNSAKNIDEIRTYQNVRNSINKLQSLVIKIMKVYSQNHGVKTHIKNV